MLLRWLLDPVLDSYLPLATVYGFVALTIWYGGWQPALLTVVGSYVAANWLFIHPRYEFSFSQKELWGLGMYVFSSLVLIVIGEAMRRARQEAYRHASAAERSEERYRSLVSVITDVPWVTDGTGAFIEPQPAWQAYTGQSWKEYRGFRWTNALHPDDRERVKDIWLRACETRTLYEAHGRLWHAKTQTWRHYVARATPLLDRDGSVREWVGSCTDVHDQKTTEQALQESEAQFSTLANNSPVLIWMNGLHGCEFVNYAYLDFLGVSRQADVARYDWVQYVHEDDRDGYLNAYLTAMETHGVFDQQFRFRRHDGVYRWMHSVGKPRLSSTGELLGYVGASFDSTDSKEAQDRLQRWNVDLEQAVNIKTAELRQSQEHLRALAAELNLAEQRERKRLATELHDHLQQMLALGKIKLGQGKRFAVSIPACAKAIGEVDEVLSEALKYTRTLVAELSPPALRDHGLPAGLKWLAEHIKKHDMIVTVNLPERLDAKLPEDQAVLLFQSVRELLINSTKHAGTHEASVTLDEGDGQLTIEVKDKGAGFDPAAAAAAAADTNSSGGITSKFGLFSIRERMRALGGSFEIQSAPGKGTTATLTLPLRGSVRDEKDSLAKPGRPVSQVSPFSPVALAARIRVLLVDDHAMMRQGLRSVLDGYADVEVVGEAWNGEDAVAAVHHRRPDVVVMDINMPKKNGIEATAEIKTRHPGTIVIGLSVNADGDNQTAMLNAGAATLLTKEAAVEHLYGAIQAAKRQCESSGE